MDDLPDERLWSLLPSPGRGELLTSWLVRLACLNRTSGESLVTLIAGRRAPVWSRDLDRSAPLDLITRISQATGVPCVGLEGFTLRALNGVMCECVNAAAAAPGVLQLGVYHRLRKHRGLMYCPQCLAEDAEPYYRQLWRVAYLCACPDHRARLMDACGRCAAPITPHRVILRGAARKWSLRHCGECGADLTGGARRAGTEQVRLARLVRAAIERGAAYLGERWVHSLPFFNGLRALYLYAGRCAAVERRLVLERADVEHRGVLSVVVGSWISDWPHSFERSLGASNLPVSVLVPTRGLLPYWIHKVVAPRYRKQAPLLQDEARAIAAATRNLREAFKVSGRRVRGDQLGRQRLEVDERAFAGLLRHLDERAVVAQKGARRIREDRIWIELLRARHMTLSDISQMTLASLRQAGDHLPEGGLLLRIREFINLYSKATDTPFVTSRQGQPIGESALGERYRAALRRADLQGVLPALNHLREL